MGARSARPPRRGDLADERTTAKSQVDIGNPSTAWQIVSTGDYDGDGKGDILWRNTNGDVAIWEINGTAPKLQADIGNVSTAWGVVE